MSTNTEWLASLKNWHGGFPKLFFFVFVCRPGFGEKRKCLNETCPKPSFSLYLRSWFGRISGIFGQDLPKAAIFIVFPLLHLERFGNIWTRPSENDYFRCTCPPGYGEVRKWLDETFPNSSFSSCLRSWFWKMSELYGRDLPKAAIFVVFALLVWEKPAIFERGRCRFRCHLPSSNRRNREYLG